MAALLEIAGLSVEIGERPLLQAVSLEVPAGAALALVGKSGSGKTTLLRACLGLLPPEARAHGHLWWQSPPDEARRDLLRATAAEWRRLRGRRIAWIPQEPSAALDPRYTAAAHLRECLAAVGRLPHRQIRERAAGLLAQVGLSLERADEYPHQWSGGMQQRLLVAMALAQSPELLLADEPTSALDALRQAQLLDLLRRLRLEWGFGLLLVTHDLAVAAAVAERVAVLRDGRVVEEGGIAQVFAHPRHEHTAALVAHQPVLAARA